MLVDVGSGAGRLLLVRVDAPVVAIVDEARNGRRRRCALVEPFAAARIVGEVAVERRRVVPVLVMLPWLTPSPSVAVVPAVVPAAILPSASSSSSTCSAVVLLTLLRRGELEGPVVRALSIRRGDGDGLAGGKKRFVASLVSCEVLVRWRLLRWQSRRSLTRRTVHRRRNDLDVLRSGMRGTRRQRRAAGRARS